MSEELILGSIVEGDVTNITKFGAFIRLPNGQEGLVHISEIADEYVTDIKKFINVSDHIKIKILNKNAQGKYDLSIKQTKEKEPNPTILYKKSKSDDFEKKIGSFLKKSEEKQIDIRRNLKLKQGIVKKRKHGQ